MIVVDSVKQAECEPSPEWQQGTKKGSASLRFLHLPPTRELACRGTAGSRALCMLNGKNLKVETKVLDFAWEIDDLKVSDKVKTIECQRYSIAKRAKGLCNAIIRG